MSRSRSRSRSPRQRDPGSPPPGAAGALQRYGHPPARLPAKATPQRRNNSDDTLFVGDLPIGLSNEELKELFEGYGTVTQARVMGAQCYGFVTFASPSDASEVLALVRMQPVTVGPHTLRVDRAHGEMPTWKQGVAIIKPREPGHQALEAYEDPSTRQLRIATVAAASKKVAAAVATKGPTAARLPLAYASIVPHPHRELVTYDDL